VPVVVPAIRSLGAAWRCQSPSRLKTILVVDDDASLRTVIRMVLEQNGYAVSEAAARLKRWLNWISYGPMSSSPT
jgi:hypothetical protein